jgi:hypothetical protein
MILRLAWKTVLAHPVRASVLGIGFGLGVGVMATLLGVGEVVLEQARAPALAGGGSLVVVSPTGALTSARFVLNAIRQAGNAGGSTLGPSVVASPRKRVDLFLIRNGRSVAVHARGGIPSLERAIGDPETSTLTAWADTKADAAWSSPDPSDVLRAMDRFHPVPDVPARAASWAEWLYFKGQVGRAERAGPAYRPGDGAAEDLRFYCTFLVGPRAADGRRYAGVRLQLERGGVVTSYSDRDLVDEPALLASAPDITIGSSHVRLEGGRYHVVLNLPGASADFIIDAPPGRSLAPVEIRGAGGWVSGYTVPVMSGALEGYLALGGARDERIAIKGSGYHDHNWGFWQDVSWRWGQVQHEGLSYIYGRVYPPQDAADPDRIPGVVVALGPDGPVGYSTRVEIEEFEDPAAGRPARILVRARGASLDLNMDIVVEDAIVTPGGALARGPDFLQLRARFHVTGHAGGEAIDFRARGASETFRSR